MSVKSIWNLFGGTSDEKKFMHLVRERKVSAYAG